MTKGISRTERMKHIWDPIYIKKKEKTERAGERGEWKTSAFKKYMSALLNFDKIIDFL